MNSEDIAIAAKWDGDPDEFVNSLVELRLLDSNGDETLEIHDWEDHQPYIFYSDERSERAKKAAAARWGNGEAPPDEDASGMPDAYDSHAGSMQDACDEHAGSNAGSMRDACKAHAGSNAGSMQGAMLNADFSNAPSPTPSPNPNPKPKPKRDPENKFTLEQCQLAQYLDQSLIENIPNKKPASKKDILKWADIARKMVDIDGRDPPDIRAHIDFAMRYENGSFTWRSAIQSMRSLREKYDRLTAQMDREKPRDRTSGEYSIYD